MCTKPPQNKTNKTKNLTILKRGQKFTRQYGIRVLLYNYFKKFKKLKSYY